MTPEEKNDPEIVQVIDVQDLYRRITGYRQRDPGPDMTMRTFTLFATSLLTGLSLAVIAIILLAGCATASQYAVYQHPTTGDRVECAKPKAKGGIPGMYGLIDAPNLDRYSECKSSLEARGYQRMGTVER
jgi:hypothetical protein